MATTEQPSWGKVDESGTVFVREGEDWRAVGAYPDGTPEEALAYFERKYQDLAGQVTLLEQRVAGGAPANDVAKGVRTLVEALREPQAVGDIESLRARVAVLDGMVSALSAQQSEIAKAQLGEAIAYRTGIVEQAEALAAIDPARTQWKQATEQINALFAAWQEHQQTGPRLPKGDAQDLWKRFRAAKTTIEANRRAFFSELDAQHREVRQAKQRLIERAEALAPRGADGVPEYRRLLDEWKLAGRAGKKHDDALWARFKAAGDVIYQAKAEVDAQDDAEFTENLTVKLALIEEGQPILTVTDHKQARSQLTALQRRWDDAGRVPRDQVRTVEDGMRKIEAHVKQLEDDFWRANNPETKARSAGLASQLEESMAKLQSEIAAARAAGDERGAASLEKNLEAQRAWLGALG